MSAMTEAPFTDHPTVKRYCETTLHSIIEQREPSYPGDRVRFWLEGAKHAAIGFESADDLLVFINRELSVAGVLP